MIWEKIRHGSVALPFQNGSAIENSGSTTENEAVLTLPISIHGLFSFQSGSTRVEASIGDGR